MVLGWVCCVLMCVIVPKRSDFVRFDLRKEISFVYVFVPMKRSLFVVSLSCHFLKFCYKKMLIDELFQTLCFSVIFLKY